MDKGNPWHPFFRNPSTGNRDFGDVCVGRGIAHCRFTPIGSHLEEDELGHRAVNGYVEIPPQRAGA